MKPVALWLGVAILVSSCGPASPIGASIPGWPVPQNVRLTEARRLSSAGRVKEARRQKSVVLRSLAKSAGLPFPVPRVYFRAFKEERKLEVWGAKDANSKFRLITTYDIAAAAGGPGPKRREGDHQVPEGFYSIDRFNPSSSYLLALGLNYPNASDRILAGKDRPGGDIFVHGDALSDGCLAMTDDKIMEIYLLALDARSAGQRNLRFDIFPFRFTRGRLARESKLSPQHRELWTVLSQADASFRATGRVPLFTVSKAGDYVLEKP